MRYSKVDQAMRTAAKPRIRYLRKYGIWACKGRCFEAVGVSPEKAYAIWWGRWDESVLPYGDLNREATAQFFKASKNSSLIRQILQEGLRK